jgi:hypothetical protein
MFAGETFPAAADYRFVLDGAGINHLVVPSLAFGATHLPVVVGWLCLAQGMGRSSVLDEGPPLLERELFFATK